MTRRFWPVAEAAQADYEALREAVLSGPPVESVAGARFARRGLAGLITWPAAEPIYTGVVHGALRPAWSPHGDPRLEALAASYELILATATDLSLAAQRVER